MFFFADVNMMKLSWLLVFFAIVSGSWGEDLGKFFDDYYKWRLFINPTGASWVSQIIFTGRTQRVPSDKPDFSNLRLRFLSGKGEGMSKKGLREGRA